MKRLADRLKPGQRPSAGFIARCSKCGLRVVHAFSTMQPHHMHARSALCRERAAKRRGVS